VSSNLTLGASASGPLCAPERQERPHETDCPWANGLVGRDRKAGVTETNVLGTELESCSEDPMTGYRRDGCCGTHPDDRGRHEVCAVVTEEFLAFSRERGNDLVTPRPKLEFPGLDPGDRWCLCLGRWVESVEADVAPPVVLEATNEAVLDDIHFSTLNEHEYAPLEHDFE
jgi:uncharacterized protein (DUF2237 family)